MTELCGLAYDAKELREMIINNPGLPLVIFAGETQEDELYTACLNIRVAIDEVLDCDQEINDEKIYCDRMDFEDDLRSYLEGKFIGWSEEDFDAFVEEEFNKYEPFWKKAIIIYADN